MRFKQGFLFGIGAFFALAVISVIIGSTMAQYVSSPSMNVSSSQGTLTVTGTGNVYATPDTAQVSIGVTDDASTASQAMSDNAAAMNNVINAIEQIGIPSMDVKTSTVSLTPKYAYQYVTGVETPSLVATPALASNNASSGSSSGTMIPVPTTPPKVLTTQIVGYTATNTVTVTVRDLSKVGPVIDAGSSNGANQINGVTFSLSDGYASSVYLQALQNATANGAAKAQTMASSLGISGLKLKSVSESSVYYPVTFEALNAAVPAAEGAISTPISVGQNQVTATVSLTYVYNM